MLLQIKLRVPEPRGDALVRPRLIELLQANLDRPLVLLTAPAGYGKTTLLAQFIARARLPVGWYQLDEGDNDPALFFEYLIECIAGCCPEFGPTTHSVLESLENVATDWQRLLVVLINELVETLSDDILVVLEDYHLIDHPLIHGFLDRLLAQSPPELHLLLSTRSDPLISLARLRARRQVAEIRAHDLRFTLAEAQAFLNDIARLDLPAKSVQSLVQETEGWVAALQLALTSLMHGPETSIQTLIGSFPGTQRYLFDYLSEEVLAAQPPQIRSFLLRTSILAQLNPDLCDALLGVDSSREILETLETQNLFTVALDDRRQWYRYHHLFRDFLQERLQWEQGDEVEALHVRAAAYFEATGDIGRAIHHYQAAGQIEKLADLIERSAPDHLARGRLHTVRRWLEGVPAEVVSARPWLMVYHGALLATQGQSQPARLWLSRARQLFSAAGDELGESRTLNQLCRLAFFEGRYEQSLELNHEALRRMRWTDHKGRTQALRTQAELWLHLGEADRAIQAIEESLAHAQQSGDRGLLAERTIMKGTIYRVAGRLTEALRILKQGLTMLEVPDILGAHIAHNQIAVVHLERWELKQALEHGRRSLALSQKFHDPAFMVYAHFILGMIYTQRDELDQVQSHFDAALAALEQTGMRSLLAEAAWNYLAEAHLKAGRYTQAEACSRKAIALRGGEGGGLAWGMGWLPLAKIYLATGQQGEAERILQQVEAASQAGGIAFYFIESAFHLGRLYLDRGQNEQATSHIERALTTAARQGHRWHFLSAGDEAVPVLIHALKHKIEPAFVQTLLRELGEPASAALTELLTYPDLEVRRYAQEMLPAEASPTVETATMTAPDTAWQVACFGDFKVRYRGQEVGEPGWLATKAGELFAYFITFRDGGIARDRILEALWPEMDPERSSGAFHTTLYRLRQTLRVGTSQQKFIRSRSGEYYLEKELFWIDADEFTQLEADCSRHPHQAMEQCGTCAERLEQMAALYQGDYLENLYDDWVLDERRRLQEVYLYALQVLAGHHAGRGDHELAISYCRHMLAKDPLLEEVHRQMMRYHAQVGDRNGIIRQYRRLEQVLADELDVEPMPETKELYQALMSGETT